MTLNVTPYEELFYFFTYDQGFQLGYLNKNY